MEDACRVGCEDGGEGLLPFAEDGIGPRGAPLKKCSSTEQGFAEAAAKDQQSRNGGGVGPLASRPRSGLGGLGISPVAHFADCRKWRRNPGRTQRVRTSESSRSPQVGFGGRK